MEGLNVYQTSYTELQKLSKSVNTNYATIDFSKLDQESAGAIRTALQNVISNRKRDVSSVLTGVK